MDLSIILQDNSSQNIIEVEMENTWTENVIPRKKLGRPFGSKNKNTTSVVQPINSYIPKKKGRPYGSKNKKRDKLRRPLTSNLGTGNIRKRGRPIGSKNRRLVEHQNVDTEFFILKPSGSKRRTNNCRGRPKTSDADSNRKEKRLGLRTHEERNYMLEVEIEVVYTL